MLPEQGVAVAACYANKIVVLRLTDGVPVGASLSLRTRHLAVDRDSVRIYCPQSNSISVIEWRGSDPAAPDYGLAVVDRIDFEAHPARISGDNSVLAFVPRSEERPVHLVIGRWGHSELYVIDLEARTLACVDGTALRRTEGGGEGGYRMPNEVTGMAVDGPGRGLLVMDLREERAAHVLPLPLPLVAAASR